MSPTSSCTAKLPSTISHLINRKASMLQDLRAAFDKRDEEMAQSYVDKPSIPYILSLVSQNCHSCISVMNTQQ